MTTSQRGGRKWRARHADTPSPRCLIALCISLTVQMARRPENGIRIHPLLPPKSTQSRIRHPNLYTSHTEKRQTSRTFPARYSEPQTKVICKRSRGSLPRDACAPASFSASTWSVLIDSETFLDSMTVDATRLSEREPRPSSSIALQTLAIVFCHVEPGADLPSTAASCRNAFRVAPAGDSLCFSQSSANDIGCLNESFSKLKGHVMNNDGVIFAARNGATIARRSGTGSRFLEQLNRQRTTTRAAAPRAATRRRASATNHSAATLQLCLVCAPSMQR